MTRLRNLIAGSPAVKRCRARILAGKWNGYPIVAVVHSVELDAFDHGKLGAHMGWINFRLTSAEALEARLKNLGSELTQALSVKTHGLLFQLQTKIVLKLSVQVLKVKTGALRSSVNGQGPTETAGLISGSVGIPHGPTYKYGVAHELGHSAPYRITAVRAKALAFQLSTKANMKKIFAHSVQHPPIPPTPFVSSVFEENDEWVMDELRKTVAEGLARN
jgi:hypothetical protein